jgi:transcriptional regulator with XRE-family HTH domain
MDFAEQLGLRIQQFRRGKGMTQEALAVRAVLTRAYLSQIENGKSWIRIDTLEAICKGLEIQPWQLLLGIDLGIGQPITPRT